jgi:cytochrome d ubiquinol oxidase subunit II
LGLAIFFLARIMGVLYVMKEVDNADIYARARLRLTGSTIAFLAFFVAYFVHLLEVNP